MTTSKTYGTLTREANEAAVQGGQIRYLDTVTAYDLWSTVYDTDGNFLQALDDREMPDLLTAVLDASPHDNLAVLDLGCGTGRNTLQAINLLRNRKASILAVDLSPKMLERAKSRCDELLKTSSTSEIKISYDTFDMVNEPLPAYEHSFDVIISTLVLEHVPADVFMKTAALLLRPGGYFIVTNMHSDMGALSQAGFVDPATKDKIRPVSYAHTVESTISTAAAAGLNCVGKFQDYQWSLSNSGYLKEITMNASLATEIGPRAKKWIGIKVWFGGMFQKIQIE